MTVLQSLKERLWSLLSLTKIQKYLKINPLEIKGFGEGLLEKQHRNSTDLLAFSEKGKTNLYPMWLKMHNSPLSLSCKVLSASLPSPSPPVLQHYQMSQGPKTKCSIVSTIGELYILESPLFQPVLNKQLLANCF